MPKRNNFFIKCCVAAALLLLPCKAYVCADYDPEGWRFWLFQPDVAGVSELLPFTYNYEKFYGADWDGSSHDTTNYFVNTKEWQAYLGGTVKERDIYKVLYQTTPDDYVGGKGLQDNTFLTALRRPKNAELLDYMGFAKQCEKVMADDGKITKTDRQKIQQTGRAMLQKATDPFAKLRYAYLVLKLDGYLHDEKDMKLQLDFIQKNAPAGAWVRDMALYNYAVSLSSKNPGLYNYNLSLAFDACRWNKVWLIRYFQPTQLPKAIALAQNNHERAVLQTMAALQYPGRALEDLQKVYQFEPSYPALSMLLAREVNKLENWLLTPKLTGNTARLEIGYEEEDKTSRDNLMRSDLAYLHQLDQFVNKVLDSGKAPDPDFWQLTAAHLMLLDGDFAKTREHLKKIAAPEKLPARLQVQFQTTQLLAELLESKTITPETENKIPILFGLIDNEKDKIKDADILKSQLALFLSDAFTQRGSAAKGALLLSKTQQDWSGTFGNRVFYLKLLETAKPADYDELLALLSRKPVTAFERWLTAAPIPFDYDPWDGEWDPNTNVFVPAKHPEAAWDLDVVREFKARHYIWQDRLDSAYLVLREIPARYWAVKDSMYRDSMTNPFAVGIELPGVALSGEKVDFGHDQAKFFKQMLDLQLEATKDTTKTQLNYLLLGNAYFNMTWMGRWWDVYNTQRSSAEFADVRVGKIPVPKTGDSGSPWSPWTFGITMMGLMLTGLFRSKSGKKFFLVGALCCLMGGFWNCNRTEPVKAPVSAWSPTVSADFDAAYYCCDRAKAYYVKALEANPGSQLAILATYMAGLCEKSREEYMYKKLHPEDYFYDILDAKIKFVPNPYLAKLPAGKKFTPAVSCAVFRSFLEETGR